MDNNLILKIRIKKTEGSEVENRTCKVTDYIASDNMVCRYQTEAFNKNYVMFAYSLWSNKNNILTKLVSYECYPQAV